jgi:spermidine synthase
VAATAEAYALSRLGDPSVLRPIVVAAAVLFAGELAFRVFGAAKARASRLAPLVLPLVCVAALRVDPLMLAPVFAAQWFAVVRLYRHHPPRRPGWCFAATLIVGAGASRLVMEQLERTPFTGRRLVTEWTRFQLLELYEREGSLRLVLDGQPQFDERDERSYHQALVQPVVAAPRVRHVLVLGGGDGLAVRTLLAQRPELRVTLVDIDAAMLELFSNHPRLRRLNQGALRQPNVRCVPIDARAFLATTRERFDAAVLDLPDPHAPGMSALYVRELIAQVSSRLNEPALIVAQAAAASVEPRSFQTVRALFDGSGLTVDSYSAPVPSFGGDATFVAASRDGVAVEALGLTRY